MLEQPDGNFILETSQAFKPHSIGFTGRSMQSFDSAQRNSPITPWQGDQYYSRIKKSIQQSSRAKSATTKSVKLKACENKAKNLYSKINTVQIQLSPLCVQTAKRSIAKWAHPIFSSTLPSKSSMAMSPTKNQEKQKQYRFTTVCFSQPAAIHQRKLSVKSIQPKIKIEHQNTELSRKKFSDLDKRKSLLFFFQVRNHNIINRQKMVMKLRNIEKGRASRAIYHMS